MLDSNVYVARINRAYEHFLLIGKGSVVYDKLVPYNGSLAFITNEGYIPIQLSVHGYMIQGYTIHKRRYEISYEVTDDIDDFGNPILKDCEVNMWTRPINDLSGIELKENKWNYDLSVCMENAEFSKYEKPKRNL